MQINSHSMEWIGLEFVNTKELSIITPSQCDPPHLLVNWCTINISSTYARYLSTYMHFNNTLN